MSESKLLEIYAALARFAVVIDGKAIPCRALEDVNGVVNTTPTRILSPLAEKSDGKNIVRLSFGDSKSLQWDIVDLCLFAPVAGGSSIEFYNPKLVKFQAYYMSHAFDDKHLGLGKSVIVNSIAVEIGEYQYPIGTNTWYFGAKATWTIRENL